jgi:hypothetical protein
LQAKARRGYEGKSRQSKAKQGQHFLFLKRGMDGIEIKEKKERERKRKRERERKRE